MRILDEGRIEQLKSAIYRLMGQRPIKVAEKNKTELDIGFFRSRKFNKFMKLSRDNYDKMMAGNGREWADRTFDNSSAGTRALEEWNACIGYCHLLIENFVDESIQLAYQKEIKKHSDALTMAEIYQDYLRVKNLDLRLSVPALSRREELVIKEEIYDIIQSSNGSENELLTPDELNSFFLSLDPDLKEKYQNVIDSYLSYVRYYNEMYEQYEDDLQRRVDSHTHDEDIQTELLVEIDSRIESLGDADLHGWDVERAFAEVAEINALIETIDVHSIMEQYQSKLRPYQETLKKVSLEAEVQIQDCLLLCSKPEISLEKKVESFNKASKLLVRINPEFNNKKEHYQRKLDQTRVILQGLAIALIKSEIDALEKADTISVESMKECNDKITMYRTVLEPQQIDLFKKQLETLLKEAEKCLKEAEKNVVDDFCRSLDENLLEVDVGNASSQRYLKMIDMLLGTYLEDLKIMSLAKYNEYRSKVQDAKDKIAHINELIQEVDEEIDSLQLKTGSIDFDERLNALKRKVDFLPEEEKNRFLTVLKELEKRKADLKNDEINKLKESLTKKLEDAFANLKKVHSYTDTYNQLQQIYKVLSEVAKECHKSSVIENLYLDRHRAYESELLNFSKRRKSYTAMYEAINHLEKSINDLQDNFEQRLSALRDIVSANDEDNYLTLADQDEFIARLNSLEKRRQNIVNSNKANEDNEFAEIRQSLVKLLEHFEEGHEYSAMDRLDIRRLNKKMSEIKEFSNNSDKKRRQLFMNLYDENTEKVQNINKQYIEFCHNHLINKITSLDIASDLFDKEWKSCSMFLINNSNFLSEEDKNKYEEKLQELQQQRENFIAEPESKVEDIHEDMPKKDTSNDEMAEILRNVAEMQQKLAAGNLSVEEQQNISNQIIELQSRLIAMMSGHISNPEFSFEFQPQESTAEPAYHDPVVLPNIDENHPDMDEEELKPIIKDTLPDDESVSLNDYEEGYGYSSFENIVPLAAFENAVERLSRLETSKDLQDVKMLIEQNKRYYTEKQMEYLNEKVQSAEQNLIQNLNRHYS